MKNLILLTFSLLLAIALQAQVSRTIHLTTAGTLSTLLTDQELGSVTSLTLTGNINARDFKTMRDEMRQIEELNMQGASIVEYTGFEGTKMGTISPEIYAANTLPDYAFNNPATNLGKRNFSSVVLPSNLTTIGAYAFYNNSCSSPFEIPASVDSIAPGALGVFSGNIVVANYNESYSSEDGVLFNVNKTTLLVYPVNKRGKYDIPNTVTKIEQNAFMSCTGITDLTIPSSVQEIGYAAFWSCTMNSLHVPWIIPLPLTKMEIFYAATNWCDLVVPKGSKAAYQAAPQWSDFRFIKEATSPYDLPITVTVGGLSTLLPQAVRDTLTYLALTGTIDARDFKTMRDSLPMLSVLDISRVTISAYSGTEGTDAVQSDYPANELPRYSFCKITGDNAQGKYSLTSIILPSGITSIGRSALCGCSNLLGDLIVPNSVITIHDYAFDGCFRINGTLSLPEGLISIGKGAFSGCSVMTGNLNIPSSVTTIGSNAFSGCGWLNGTLTLPPNITSISDSAFYSCVRLTGNLTIPATVTSIGNFAFGNCGKFTGNLVLPANLSFLGAYAFCGGKFTGTLTIPTAITEIKDGTFAYGSGYTSVVFPPVVTKIGNSAFESCFAWTGILSLPSTVRSIGDAAFSNCDKLTTIDFPDSLKSIGSSAFAGCIGLLDTLTIPNSVTTIGETAFQSCTGLTVVNLPNTLQSISYGVFKYCSGLTGSFKIPESVTEIGFAAFASCTSLSSINIPHSVTAIYQSAFNTCTSLTSIWNYCQIPVNLSSSPYVFENVHQTTCVLYVPAGTKEAYQAANRWKDFTNIVEMKSPFEMPLNVTAGGLASLLPQTVRDTLTYMALTGTIDARDFKTMRDSLPNLAVIDLSRVSIAEYTGAEGTAKVSTTYPANAVPNNAFYNPITFQGKNPLVSVFLPQSLTIVGNQAFQFCSNLKSCATPSSVTIIGAEAFQYCGLTSITIPSLVTSIGTFAFFGTSIEVTVSNFNLDYSSMDGILFDKNKTKLIFCPRSKTGIYTIPPSVTILDDNAFNQCNGLTTVIIPSSVKSIGFGAFANCNGLTNISIPFSVLSIGSQALFGCTSLMSIYSNLPIPIDLSSSEGVFTNINKTTSKLYVPYGSKSAYQAANQWEDFTNIVETVTCTAGGLASLIPEATRNTLTALSIQGVIDARDFKTMRDSMPLLSVVDLSNVTIAAYTGTEGAEKVSTTYPANTVPNNAFYNPITYQGKTSLKSVFLPFSVTSIGNYSFAGCSGLNLCAIPPLVTSIGNLAFNRCSSFSSVFIPPSVSSIGDGAFLLCSGLITVDATNPNYSGLDGVLYNKTQTILIQCPTLKTGSFTPPPAVSLIGNRAFLGCDNLNLINLLPSVKTIGNEAFESCGGLKSVIIPSSVDTIGSFAFYGCSGLSYIYLSSNLPVNLSSSDRVFEYVNKTTCKLYVPYGSKSAYQAANQWGDFQNIVEIQPAIEVTAGNLKTLLAGQLDTITSLTLTGTIDARDFKTMRDSMPLLAEIDLCGATVAAYTGTEGTDGSVNSVAYPANAIPQYAFFIPGMGKDLTSFVFPTSVTSIGAMAFAHCRKLTTISIPSSVNFIDYSVFMDCIGLNSIFANPITPVDLSTTYNVFFMVDIATCKLYVPSGSKSAYQAANQWKDFTNIEEIPGFRLSKTTANVSDKGGSTDFVNVNSYTSWNASSDKSWLTVSPETGTGDNTLVFTASANTTSTERTAIVTVSATGFPSQIITVTQAAGEEGVPSITALSGITLSDTTTCYNATDSITIAGNGTTVSFESGSSVTLISGKSIRFLPGFHSAEGSFMSASITTNNTFCNSQSGSIVEQPQEKSVAEETQSEEEGFVPVEKSIKIYPNPTTGRFTVELINFDNVTKVCLYNSMGAKVFQSESNSSSQEIDVPGLRKGIYFVRISNGKEQVTKKLVVN